MHAYLRLKLIAAVLLGVSATSVFGQTHVFADNREFVTWLSYYYTRPEPQRVSEALAYMKSQGLLEVSAAQPLLAGFMSGVFHDNPDRLDAWLLQSGNYPADQYSVILLGVWHAEMDDGRTRVISAIEKDEKLRANLGFLVSGQARVLTEVPMEKGYWVLNTLWGRFMATGDERAVIRIMQALPWVEHLGRPGHMSIGRAAYWSLAANAARHPKVMAICEAQLSRQPDGVAAILKKVIAQAKQPLADHEEWGLPVSR